MKATLKYAMAVGITTTAMFAYMYETPPKKIAQEEAQTPNAATLEPGDVYALSREQRESNLSKLVDSLNSMGGQQYLTQEQAEYKANYGPEKERFQRINIEPWNVQQTQCFSAEESNDGTERCETTWKYPRHHYYSASTDELLELAYTDALAATIAAKRIAKQDTELSFKLRMHAAVLADKAGPLVDAAYSLRPQLNRDLEPAESDYVFFALINIATKMGYEHNDPEYTPAYFSLDSEKLAKYTKALALDLAQLQSTVSGSTNLKELFDV